MTSDDFQIHVFKVLDGERWRGEVLRNGKVAFMAACEFTRAEALRKACDWLTNELAFLGGRQPCDRSLQN